MTWKQKFAIIVELEKRQNQDVNCTVAEICEWAKKIFNLQEIPYRNTVAKVNREKILSKNLLVKEKLKRNK